MYVLSFYFTLCEQVAVCKVILVLVIDDSSVSLECYLYLYIYIYIYIVVSFVHASFYHPRSFRLSIQQGRANGHESHSGKDACGQITSYVYTVYCSR